MKLKISNLYIGQDLTIKTVRHHHSFSINETVKILEFDTQDTNFPIFVGTISYAAWVNLDDVELCTKMVKECDKSDISKKFKSIEKISLDIKEIKIGDRFIINDDSVILHQFRKDDIVTVRLVDYNDQRYPIFVTGINNSWGEWISLDCIDPYNESNIEEFVYTTQQMELLHCYFIKTNFTSATAFIKWLSQENRNKLLR